MICQATKEDGQTKTELHFGDVIDEWTCFWFNSRTDWYDRALRKLARPTLGMIYKRLSANQSKNLGAFVL